LAQFVLRHACGYALANAGHDTRAIQDWLGHRAIQHVHVNLEREAGSFTNTLDQAIDGVGGEWGAALVGEHKGGAWRLVAP
jgi:hypothetical protein